MMRSREEREQERREAIADAYYELWRSGRNPEAACSDRAYDLSWDYDGESIARILARGHDARRQSRDEEGWTPNE